MIIHSIVSPADIFCNSGGCPKSRYARVDGGLLELENDRVKRLISTDPRLYLDKRYRPGSAYNAAHRP